MALLTLTLTSNGSSFSLDESDIVKMYELNSQTTIEAVHGETSITKFFKVDETASAVSSASSNLFSTTVNGGTLYLNNNRVLRVEEINSLARVTYDANGDKPEIIRTDVTQSAFEASTPNQGSVSYKEYYATLTQTGTNPPVANVLINTLSGTPVWSRFTAGSYYMTLANEFPAGTKVEHNMVGNTTLDRPAAYWEDVNTIYYEMYNTSTGAASDNAMYGTASHWIHVKVFDFL